MADIFDEPGGTAPAPHATLDASDFFTKGAESCRFTNIGDSHQGVILDFKKGQQRDIKTGEPAFWPDGNEKEMLVISIQTEERDPEIEDDDGQRKLYVKKPSGMFAAIMAAIGKEKFTVGATLAVKYTGNDKPTTTGFNSPKLYKAVYVPIGGKSHVASPASPQSPKPQAGAVSPLVNAAKLAAWNTFKAKTPGMTDAIRKDSFGPTVTAYSGVQPDRFPLLTVSEWAAITAKINELGAYEAAPADMPMDEIPF